MGENHTIGQRTARLASHQTIKRMILSASSDASYHSALRDAAGSPRAIEHSSARK